jgi:hypothetical protein
MVISRTMKCTSLTYWTYQYHCNVRYLIQGQIKEGQILQKARVQLRGCPVEVQQYTNHLLRTTGLLVKVVYIVLSQFVKKRKVSVCKE